VQLTDTPPDSGEAIKLPDLKLERVAAHAPYAAIGLPGRDFQVAISVAGTGQFAAVLLPLDPDFPARLEAARRLWRKVRGHATDPPGTLAAHRRKRLVTTLRALDGRAAGASIRVIATALFGPERIPSGPEWKVHDLRSRTKRLVDSGLHLMKGGYCDLLRSSRSRRDD
jgi:hypothetical protein